jgi:hypothetical protein
MTEGCAILQHLACHTSTQALRLKFVGMEKKWLVQTVAEPEFDVRGGPRKVI